MFELMHYRSRFETIMDVLTIVHQPGGEIRTRIMNRSNLSWMRMIANMELCSKYGLVAREDARYNITEKGRLAIQKYLELQDLLPQEIFAKYAVEVVSFA